MRPSCAHGFATLAVLTGLTICCSGCGMTNGYVMNQSGQAYYRHGQYADARREFQKAAVEHPGNANYLANLALSMKKQGDVPRAEQTYRQALDADPSHQPAWHGLAQLLVEQNRTPEAQNVLQEWAGSQPYSAEPHLELAWLQRSTGNPAGAGQALQQAYRINPNHPKTLAHLGQHYEATGQTGAATAMYQRSLQHDWNQPQVHSRLETLRQQGGASAAVGIVSAPPSFAPPTTMTSAPPIGGTFVNSQPVPMAAPMMMSNTQVMTTPVGIPSAAGPLQTPIAGQPQQQITTQIGVPVSPVPNADPAHVPMAAVPNVAYVTPF